MAKGTIIDAVNRFRGKDFNEMMQSDISGVRTPDQKKEQILFEMLRTTIGLLDKQGKFDYFIACKTEQWDICTREQTIRMYNPERKEACNG